jgi:hypothetical protein
MAADGRHGRISPTLIESFFPDEELDAVRAVARLYLADMRS